MAKSSTYQELLQRDIRQWQSLIWRYRKQSSLSRMEKSKHRPQPKKYPRDRVMRRIMKLHVEMILKSIMRVQVEESKNKSIIRPSK